MKLKHSRITQKLCDVIDALIRFGLHIAPSEELALWWGYRYRPAPTIAKLRSGPLIGITENDHLQLLLYYCGEFEPKCVELMKKHLKAGSVVVDVGANIGLYTIEAAAAVGSTGQVVAIEASPAHYKTLTGNVGLNGFRNVTTVSSAAGDSEDVAKLTLPDGANRGMFTLGAVAGCSSTMVKVRRIDDILEEQSIKSVDFIKIDIEGSELRALKGAAETLKRSHPAILIELNEAALRSCGTTSNEVKSFLASLKYKGFIIGRNGLSPLSPAQTTHSCDECLFI